MITREQRIAEIKAKGFTMVPDRSNDIGYYRESYAPVDFGKIKVGMKTLQDATLNIGTYGKFNPSLGNKEEVLRAIARGDVDKMRSISEYFYRTSGIYQRLVRYLAYMYRYDWFIVPYIHGGMSVVQTDGDTIKQTEVKKICDNFFAILKVFDDFGCKKFFGSVALKVIKYGCYYGYLVGEKNKVMVQELPIKYCRSRFQINGRPAIEFNMSYFDDMFSDSTQKQQILNLFPKEFKKGYLLYRQGKLPPQFQGDTSGWYLLDPRCAIKFNINDGDFPPFISVIPALIDLDAAQELDRRKMAQKLLKIIIQKLPLDKNGDLVFDIDEANEIHNNAVAMLTKAIGVDVLTTFADVEVADMADKSTTTTTDELEKIERTVYNEAGVSQLQFNSEGNIALNNSILNDEATIYDLVLQFESFMNMILEPFNKQPKKFYYRAQILTTTIYNYKELSKMYKEQTQLGHSKILPQLALGQSQSAILATASFENDVLDLVNIFIPPMSSNTMNAQVLSDRNAKMPNKSENVAGVASENKSDTGGRPEKEDSQKSEKTILNKESMT